MERPSTISRRWGGDHTDINNTSAQGMQPDPRVPIHMEGIQIAPNMRSSAIG
jgi:hypothetical protein